MRLKDVNELFMDTGMGREGYSIIGQGKIDEILSVKSGERREVFEEAAGISKYRHRKEDSERKLERTEENLVRINDKIAELELQVEPLRQQAETAKKYLVLRDELRVLEISVWLEQLQDLRTARLKLESDTALAKAECDRAQQALDESYALGESFTEQMRQNDIQAETLRQQAGESDSAAGEESAAIAVLQTSIDHNNDSLRRLEQELTNTDARRENLQGQIDAQLAHIADIDSSAAELGRELDALLAQAQFTELMVEVNRVVRGGHRVGAAGGDSKVISLLQYLNLHLTEPLTIDQLAERFYISKYHMMRRFRQETGYSVHGYLTEKRLLLAQQLLARGCTPAEAAVQAGYQDYSTFSRAYKKQFGRSPSADAEKEHNLQVTTQDL